MITTTQTRILRTYLCAHPISLPIRTTPGLSLVRQHLPRCLPPPSSPLSATRSLSTTSLLSAAEAPKTSTPTAHAIEQRSPNYHLSPTAANPPATTRPPPLDLPARDPNTSTFSFLFTTGKAYLTFYKTGVKNIYLNTRLVWSLNAAAGVPRADGPTTPTPIRAVGSTTRSTFLLRRRWRYDVRRLPLFALLLLVCGEFTPFVVMAMPALVPYTCRIPRQIEALQRKAEERRAASFRRLEQARGNDKKMAQTTMTGAGPTSAEAAAHIARSLNLISPLWDRLGLPDAALVLASTQRKVQRHVALLREDDALLVQAGGVDALLGEEVVLACADRAIGTVGRSDEDLRERLRRWLQYTQEQMDDEAQFRCLTDRLLHKQD